MIFFFIVPAQFALSSNEREISIYKNLRCLVCQGQSLNDSNSDFAVDLKKVIKEKIINKQSDQEIYKYLTERYGEWILFNPPFKKKTALLWVLPLLLLLIGGYGIVRKVKIIRKNDKN